MDAGSATAQTSLLRSEPSPDAIWAPVVAVKSESFLVSRYLVKPPGAYVEHGDDLKYRFVPLPIHRSALLPVEHGFTTRLGGVSDGPFRSLNVSGSVGDDPERVARNVQLVAREVGLAASQMLTASQVHGDRVLGDLVGWSGGSFATSCGEADALWTASAESAVAIRVADCVPVLLVDPRLRAVAAVHSGWRGTELGIAGKTVHQLESRGSRASDLIAAIGPSIRACCYAVSEELAARFSAAFGLAIVRFANGKHFLDLAEAVRGTLIQAGVRREQIDVLPACTCCAADEFFSHRRDNGATGRQMGFVVCRF
jgi:YfiH family protein